MVLDGHSHSVIPCRIVTDKSGDEVLLSSTGTELNYIGQLLITPDGNLTTALISDYPEIDADMDGYVKEIQAKFEEDMNKVVAHSEIPLSISLEDGIRLVRSRETGIEDLCADALNLFVDNMLTLDEGMPDYQGILTYITEELGGSVDSTYASPQGRIRIE